MLEMNREQALRYLEELSEIAKNHPFVFSKETYTALKIGCDALKEKIEEDELIDEVGKRVLKKYLPTFKNLAKGKQE